MTNVQTAYEKGVLNPVSHAMLVSDAAKYCQRAGIAEQWLYRASSDTLSEREIKYLRKVPLLATSGKFGYAMVGDCGDHLSKMCAMAAALVRAFVDARVMTAGAVVDSARDGGVVATVLLIPNLYSPEEVGKFDQVKVGVLGDVLTSRAAEGLQTVVWVHSMEGVLKSFGQRVHVLLTKSYLS